MALEYIIHPHYCRRRHVCGPVPIRHGDTYLAIHASGASWCAREGCSERCLWFARRLRRQHCHILTYRWCYCRYRPPTPSHIPRRTRNDDSGHGITGAWQECGNTCVSSCVSRHEWCRRMDNRNGNIIGDSWAAKPRDCGWYSESNPHQHFVHTVTRC